MHQCSLCGKWFPRPSGLATHMNTHAGDKPFKCPARDCDESFTVRSNAKRHLKTHGPDPSPPDTCGPPSFAVGFESPYIAHNTHDSGGALPQLKWVPPSPATQMTADGLGSLSGSDQMHGGQPPSPLSVVHPSGPSAKLG